MQPLISIIMPVYNSAHYLKGSVESVLKQSFGDFELILIDDGSTDSSGKICDEYAKKDARIRVFHQQNQGISTARNAGIYAAIGNYIGFIDNDDEICEDLLERIASAIKKENEYPDVIKYGYQVEETFDKGFTQVRKNYTDMELHFNKTNLAEIYDQIVQAGYFNMVWNGFYKNDFISNNKIIFDNSIKAGYEDWIFNYQICSNDCSQIMIAGVGYIHYQRYNHSTSKKFNENQILALVTAATAEKKMFEFINTNGVSTIDWSTKAVEYIIELLLLFERNGCNLSRKQKIEFLKSFYISAVFEPLRNMVPYKISSLRKILLKLFLGKNFNALLFLSKIYYQFILIKKRYI